MIFIMLKHDYVMKIIESIIKFLAKLFLDKDIVVYELPSEKNYTQTDYLHEQLLDLIKQGKINEAENLLYENLASNKKYIELTLDFYSRLNKLDDKFLEDNNFSRKEIEQGLKDISKKFGIMI